MITFWLLKSVSQFTFPDGPLNLVQMSNKNFWFTETIPGLKTSGDTIKYMC